ncbi:hypothetical protein [Dechloromonas sp. A34]|uniref:hypothetical protein n=1 Tax=Dechloromonas sp. A34 TaxID=447588 RepID=UPI002248E7C5|nr:hypothetical protein [Dechloromonas sp. A34]
MIKLAGLFFTLCLTLSGCTGYAGSRLQTGVSGRAEVLAEMGEPAMRWQAADGGEQLAYPRGPLGPHTYMVFIGADGRLQKIENVLDVPHFARIETGKSDQAAVLRLLGPPAPEWTVYFEARDELVWEWLFCDDFSRLARFDVLFDGTTGLVRTTMQRPERRGRDGTAPFCGR